MNISSLARTYILTDVSAFLDSVTYRMLADGLILQDVHAIRGAVGDWSGWLPFLEGRAQNYERLGQAALAEGGQATAAAHFAHGALCAHYAQFLYFDDAVTKRRVTALKNALFAQAAPLLATPTIPLEIPFRASSLPAYLRVPAGSPPWPLAILVGGMDATKEDSRQFSDLCIARGLGTLSFDGPGQGETFGRGLLFDASFREAISAAIDFAATRPEVDADRIGAVGRSLGGFLACEAAAFDLRIKACVVWGAFYDYTVLDHMPPLVADGFRFITGAANLDETSERMKFVDLSGVAERIACPLLVVHGTADNVVPVAMAQRTFDEAAGEKELLLIPDSIHCNHDCSHIARPAMADWISAQL